jgi:hypothetical protein
MTATLHIEEVGKLSDLENLKEEVEKFNLYYAGLRKVRRRMKKHPEEFTEQQIDDMRIEWAVNKSAKRLNSWNEDAIDMTGEIINIFLDDSEVLPISELKRRLDIGSGFGYDAEQGLLTRALRLLEDYGAVRINREPGLSIAYQLIARVEETDPFTPAQVDSHGVSRCICDGCTVKLVDLSGEPIGMKRL